MLFQGQHLQIISINNNYKIENFLTQRVTGNCQNVLKILNYFYNIPCTAYCLLDLILSTLSNDNYTNEVSEKIFGILGELFQEIFKFKTKQFFLLHPVYINITSGALSIGYIYNNDHLNLISNLVH